MIKTVLFDFDGTLVNTNDVIIASWQYTYKHYTGKEQSLEKITECFGEPLLITMAREFPDIPPEESAEVYRNFQKEHCEDLVSVFPEIPALLETLRSSGYRMAIVTSRTRESADRYLSTFGIESYFDDMVSCDDTSIHKPNPEPVLLCLDKMKEKKEQAIMVGDSAFDIKCANNAGVLSVLVDWRITGNGTSEVSDAKADYQIEKPLNLLKILAELNQEK